MKEIFDKYGKIISLEDYKNYDVFRSNDEGLEISYYYIVFVDGKYYILYRSSCLVKGKFEEYYYPISVRQANYLINISEDFTDDVRACIAEILVKKSGKS